jgi:CDP-2,3-bis-(O-geranylgeranyl)-sn-glycerol synthase
VTSLLWLFLPLLGAFLAHAPVLRFDWLRPLKRPLDGGATFRGRRLLGDNKTWRGAIVMSSGVVVAALLLSGWDAYWARLPDEIRSAGPLLFGVLCGLGAVLAELPGSFLKRQLGVPPGGQVRSLAGGLLSLWDQGDFVVGVWLLLLPIWRIPAGPLALSFLLVALGHLGISVLGHALGARRTVL